jgi:hypothetical protein
MVKLQIDQTHGNHGDAPYQELAGGDRARDRLKQAPFRPAIDCDVRCIRQYNEVLPNVNLLLIHLPN